MGILLWLLLGIGLGLIAYALDHEDSHLLWLEYVILGMIGSGIGTLLGDVVWKVQPNDYSWPVFLYALAGSCALLYINRAV